MCRVIDINDECCFVIIMTLLINAYIIRSHKNLNAYHLNHYTCTYAVSPFLAASMNGLKSPKLTMLGSAPASKRSVIICKC